MKYWHEWFVLPEDDEPLHQSEDDIRVVAGSGHREDDRPLHLRKKLPPRCARCKRFMGHNSGMHIMLTQDWRIHIHCFNKVIEEHLEEGETIDMVTGQVVKADKPEDN